MDRDTAIWQAFEDRCRKMHHEGRPPVLVLLVGLPGSGKSHLARDLGRRIPALVVEADAVRKSLFRHPRYTSAEHGNVHSVARRLILEGLKRGVSVVDDATNLIEANRRRIYRLGDTLDVPLIIVRITAPEEIIQRRLAARAATVDSLSDATWDVYRHMRGEQERICRPYVKVDTAADYNTGLARVMAIIRQKQGERMGESG